MISGFPKSGKTHRSQQLISDFERRIAASEDPRIQRLKIHHINDDNLGLDRNVYATARAEKDARATLSSAIKRVLTRDNIVIADAMNYIKGFRYQLYCEAKAVQTPSCVVHVGTQAEQCRKFNNEAGEGAYESEVFDNLVFRYEEPNGMARWDAPLFSIPFEDETPPCDLIWEAITNPTKTVKPNAATVLKPAAQQDYLYELDKTTSEVISAITAWTADHAGEGGGSVNVGAENEIELPMTAPSVAQLQRLRRQFIQLNRQHELKKERVRVLFVDHLNDAFAK